MACAPPDLVAVMKSLALAPGRGAAAGDALVIPVVGAVVRVQLPVVARGGVAAPAIERRIQFVELARRGERDAVDERIDCVTVAGGVNGNGHRTTGAGDAVADDERDVVHVERGRETGVSSLPPNAVKIGCRRDAQRRQRNDFLPPGVDRERDENDGVLRDSIALRLHLHRLAARAAAIDPKVRCVKAAPFCAV